MIKHQLKLIPLVSLIMMPLHAMDNTQRNRCTEIVEDAVCDCYVNCLLGCFACYRGIVKVVNPAYYAQKMRERDAWYARKAAQRDFEERQELLQRVADSKAMLRELQAERELNRKVEESRAMLRELQAERLRNRQTTTDSSAQVTDSNSTINTLG